MDTIQKQHQVKIIHTQPENIASYFLCGCGWQSQKIGEVGLGQTFSSRGRILYQEWLDHLKEMGTSICGDLRVTA